MANLWRADLPEHKGRLLASVILNELLLDIIREEEPGPSDDFPRRVEQSWENLLLAAFYAGESVYGEEEWVQDKLRDMVEEGKVIDEPTTYEGSPHEVEGGPLIDE